MSTLTTNRRSAGSGWTRSALTCLMSLALASGCGSDGANGAGGAGGGGGTDGLIDAKIFEVDMQVDSWDTSQEETPQFSSVASMLFGTFPIDPLAVTYTVEYTNPDFPAFESSGSWGGQNIAGVRDPLPDQFRTSNGIIPGYVDGIVGGEYFIRIAGSGCQGGAGGDCRLGTESTLATESLLKDIRQSGTLKVTIEFE